MNDKLPKELIDLLKDLPSALEGHMEDRGDKEAEDAADLDQKDPVPSDPRDHAMVIIVMRGLKSMEKDPDMED